MPEQTRPKRPPLTESQKTAAQDRADEETTGGVEDVRSAIQEAKDALDRAEEALDAVAAQS